MKRLIFPCGAYFPIQDGDQLLLERAHRSKDGAYRICVHPSSKPHLDENGECLARVKERHDVDYDGDRAPCRYFCPVKNRRKEERGWDLSGKLGTFISCHARLYAQEHLADGDEGWYDITPQPPAKCPHCEEQRTYVLACKRAAKAGEEAPDRERWEKCPQCQQHRELTLDTGLCATCQLVKVVEENHERDASLSQLYEKLERLKAHVCSYDERESGCPVCEDEKQVEHQIRLLGGRVRKVRG